MIMVTGNASVTFIHVFTFLVHGKDTVFATVTASDNMCHFRNLIAIDLPQCPVPSTRIKLILSRKQLFWDHLFLGTFQQHWSAQKKKKKKTAQVTLIIIYLKFLPILYHWNDHAITL